MENITIPRYLDDPPSLLFWQIDEVLPAIVVMGIGFLMGHIFIAIILAYVSIKITSKLKENAQEGYAKHLFYWFGIIKPKNSTTIKNGYQREYYS